MEESEKDNNNTRARIKREINQIKQKIHKQTQLTPDTDKQTLKRKAAKEVIEQKYSTEQNNEHVIKSTPTQIDETQLIMERNTTDEVILMEVPDVETNGSHRTPAPHSTPVLPATNSSTNHYSLRKGNKIRRQLRQTHEKTNQRYIENLIKNGLNNIAKDLQQTLSFNSLQHEENMAIMQQQINTQTKQINEQHSKINEQITQLNIEKATLIEENGKLTALTKETTAEINYQKEQVQQQKVNNFQLIAKITQQNEEINNLKTLQDETSRQKEEITRLNNIILNLENNLEHQRQQFNPYTLNSLKTDNNLLRQEIETIKREKTKLESEIKNQKQQQLPYHALEDQTHRRPRQAQPKSTIVIQPTGEENTVRDIQERVAHLNKPNEIKITKLKPNSRALEIRCEDEQQKDTLKHFLSNQADLQQIASIHDKTPSYTKLIFPNLSTQITNDRIIETIQQEHGVNKTDITVIQRTQSYSNRDTENLIIQIPRTTAKLIIQQKSILIGFRSIRCSKYIKLYRCRNCHQFNDHDTAECPAQTRCAWCAGRHRIDDCPTQHPKCHNCIEWNVHCERKGNPNEAIKDYKHPTYYTQCPIYLHERRYRATLI